MTDPSQVSMIRSFGASDIGRRREINEDAFLRDDELSLWVVADGMGGHAAGEIASREAIDTVYGMVKRGRSKLNLSEPLSQEQLFQVCRLLEQAVQAATYIVFALGEMDKGKTGMGTTLSAMLAVGRFGITAQVGDSRIYQVRDQQVTQLTEDHTLVAWQIKQGFITEEEAKHSRHRNVITRAVGNRDYVQVDTGVVELQAGDRYLLCSDGLHGYLTPSEIPELTAVGGDEAVAGFIELANSRGGKDNITVVLVEVI